MERLSEQLNVPIFVLDMNANPEAAGRFGINATPTVIRYVNGQEAERLVGGHTDEQWEQLLLRYKHAATGTNETNETNDDA